MLFVDFLADFFLAFLGREGKTEGVVWALSCFLFSFFPFLPSLFSFFLLSLFFKLIYFYF